jgi:hypothetical protein
VILAIDPGNVESAYVVLDDNLKAVEFAKIKNELLIGFLYGDRFLKVNNFAIEMIASYGMAVGKEVFTKLYPGPMMKNQSIFIVKMKK